MWPRAVLGAAAAAERRDVDLVAHAVRTAAAAGLIGMSTVLEAIAARPGSEHRPHSRPAGAAAAAALKARRAG
jgi:hypothetical protein